MSDTVFCYSCRKHHPRENVVQVQSKGVKRWRCLRSLVENRKGRDRCDAFRKSTTERNRSTGLRKAMHSLLRPVLELFRGMPWRPEERI